MNARTLETMAGNASIDVGTIADGVESIIEELKDDYDPSDPMTDSRERIKELRERVKELRAIGLSLEKMRF